MRRRATGAMGRAMSLAIGLAVGAALVLGGLYASGSLTSRTVTETMTATNTTTTTTDIPLTATVTSLTTTTSLITTTTTIYHPVALHFLSGILITFPSSNGTGSDASILLFVENVANKPIVSLNATLIGLPTLHFEVVNYALNSSNPLYPGEATNNIIPPGGRYHSSVRYTNGTEYSVTFSAKLSNGTSSQLIQTFTYQGGESGFTPQGNVPPPCGVALSRNDTFPASVMSFKVNATSGQAEMVESIRNALHFPAVLVSLGVNKGTLWLPFDYQGAPIGPSNPLPVGANVTQTFTWTLQPGTSKTQIVHWVGSCADENALVTSSTFGFSLR